MDKEQYLRQMLSLCAKAGKIASGEFQCEEAIASFEAKIIFVSSDASANTVKKFSNKCDFYHVTFYQLTATKAELGKIIGKEMRSCVAVLDEGLAQTMLNKAINRKVDMSQ